MNFFLIYILPALVGFGLMTAANFTTLLGRTSTIILAALVGSIVTVFVLGALSVETTLRVVYL
jgi:hypothetical protein